MGKPKAPDPIDPIATGAAQTGTNVATAIANAQLNNVNQVTDDGTLTYSQTGTYTFTDPNSGETYEIPKTTLTTTLSPMQQEIKNQLDETKLGLNTIANNQTNFLKDYLGTPFDGSNNATEARLMELGRKRLDPLLAQRKASLESQLANQGIKIGSKAYETAMSQNMQGENDLYNQLLLTGRGQAFQEGQAIRNQPINEITALLSGGQVSQPNFSSTNQGSIPTTDYAGLMTTAKNQEMNSWQQNNANRQNFLGGLFGLGAGLISDRRLKKDIVRLSKTAAGYFKYAYRYLTDKPDSPYRIGYMAQEVQKFAPHAVINMGGLLALDYSKLEAV